MSKKMDMVFKQAASKVSLIYHNGFYKVYEQLEKQNMRKKSTKPSTELSLQEIQMTGLLPDSTQEIEAQFKGLIGTAGS